MDQAITLIFILCIALLSVLQINAQTDENDDKNWPEDGSPFVLPTLDKEIIGSKGLNVKNPV